MCGIAGFLFTHRETNDPRGVVSKMAERLRHRGPDDGGIWVDEAAGVALGHRRLAVIDLSADGRQPMISRDERYVLSYNGEIYNFIELRDELMRQGVRFQGCSDTEVLLAAVERWGLDAAIRRSIGMFAFALWDRTARTLHLARDRMGEKPLYYGWRGKSFLFASELKALRAHPDWEGDINAAALADYHETGLRTRSIFHLQGNLQTAARLRLEPPCFGPTRASAGAARVLARGRFGGTRIRRKEGVL